MTRTPRMAGRLVGLAVATLLAPGAWAQSSSGPEKQEKADRQDPEYALAPIARPCVGRACGFLQVVDLGYRARTPGARQRGELRLLLANRAYLGGEWSRGRRGASVRLARLDASYEHRPGRGDAARLEVRAPRIRVGLAATRAPRQATDGWRVDGEAGYRVGTDLEVGIGWVRDLSADRAGFEPLVTRGGSAFVRWQPGFRHELEGSARLERLRTPVGIEIDRFAAQARWEGLIDPFRIRAGIAYDRLSGPFGRSEFAFDLVARARLGDRITADLGWREALETGLASVQRHVRGGAALYARRFRFARGGAAAPAVDRLVRSAHRAGINEMRSFGVPGMRALRERAALSGVDELVGLAEALRRATVADRNVELLGVAIGWTKDLDLGSRHRRVVVRLGVPWPLAPPWRADERAVDFVSVAVAYEEADLTAGLREYGRSIAVRIALHRELELHAEWERPVRTPLQLTLGVEPGDRGQIGLVYAFGR